MTTATNKTSVDTFVNEGSPTRNYDTFSSIAIGDTAGQVRYGYLLLGLPFSRGSKVNVHQGKLRLWNTQAWAGSVTVRIRLITSTWTRNLMTWNGTGARGRPTVGGAVADVTKVGAAANTMWEFDVESLLQYVSNGGAWYGFRIEIIAGAGAWYNVWGSAAALSYRPELFTEFSSAPEPPSVLHPSMNKFVSRQYPTFQTNFSDTSGSTQMGGMQIQIDADKTGAADYDSGWVTIGVPEIVTEPGDPNYPAGMPAWGGIAADAVTWWRCQVKDTAGLESGWSEWAQFGRKTKGILTIVSPGTTTSDASFTVAWTFTGRQQISYCVIIRDLNGVEKHNSGKVTSYNAYHPLPSNIPLKDDQAYICEVQIWDDQNRIATPGDQTYQSATKQFTFDFSTAVTPFNNIVVSQWNDTPWVLFYLDRATIPDKINVWRDGVLFWSGAAGQLYLPGPDTYGFLDHLAKAHEQHIWHFQAVVNDIGSPFTSTTYTPRIPTPWIGDFAVGGMYIWNPEVEMYDDINEEVVDFVGNYSSAVVVTGDKGVKGSISGKVTPESAPWMGSMTTIKAYLDYILSRPGVQREIHVVNQAFFGYIHSSKVTPRKDNDGVYYDISISFGENV